MRLYLALLLPLAFVVFAKAQPQLADGFVRELLAEELNPSGMALAPDGRLFVLDKSGSVLVYRDGRMLEEPFLSLAVDDHNERGLSGITFHPDFERNGYVYLYYTAPRRGRNRISRFRANGDFAVPGSEEVLFELDSLLGSVHNGGAMAWLPDTTLLVSVGDGGRSAFAQSFGYDYGKFLRLRDDGSIPGDNPFYDTQAGKARAIYGLGLRNSFSMAAQASTGRVFANDVGGGAWEEINEVLPGANYGWPIVEGYNGVEQAPPGYVAPRYAYSHGEGCAIVGATFYEPPRTDWPEGYVGKYLYGDYCTGQIRVIDPVTYERSEPLARGLDRVITFAVDTTGDLYYLARGRGDGSVGDNTATREGTLWRLSYAGSGAPVVSRAPRSVLLPRGDTAAFRVSVSGTAPYAYAWLRDGVPVAGAEEPVLRVPDVQLADDGAAFRVIVTNAFGSDTSAAAVLSVTANTRPTVAIAAPAADATYRAGDVIAFAGAVTDAEDGELDAAELTWRIDFHHDDHSHPGEQLRGRADGEFEVPTLGEVSANVFYRFTLTATDADGLTATRHVDVHPEVTDLSFATEPPGLDLNIDGLTRAAPFAVESVVGLDRLVVAPAGQVLDGEIYVFEEWTAPAPEAERAIRFSAAPEGNAFAARYRSVAKGDGTGLTGVYYLSATDTSAYRELAARVDSVVDFHWRDGTAGIELPPRGFGVTWTGDIEPPLDGEYRFIVGGDDRTALYVDGELLISGPPNRPFAYNTAVIRLEGQRRVPIRLEYEEGGGGGGVSLAWGHVALAEAVVPTWALYPESLSAFEPAGEVTAGAGFEMAAPRVEPGGIVLVRARLTDSTAATSEVSIALADVLGRPIGQARAARLAPRWREYRVAVGDLPRGLYFVTVAAGPERRSLPVMAY